MHSIEAYNRSNVTQGDPTGRGQGRPVWNLIELVKIVKLVKADWQNEPRNQDGSGTLWRMQG